MDINQKIEKFLKLSEDQTPTYESSSSLLRENVKNYLETINSTMLTAFEIIKKAYPADKNIQKIAAEYSKNFNNIKKSVDIYVDKLYKSKSKKDLDTIYTLIVNLSNYVRGDVPKYLYKIPGYGPVYFSSVQSAFSKFLYSKNQLEQFLK